jgi:hypothetical protein
VDNGICQECANEIGGKQLQAMLVISYCLECRKIIKKDKELERRKPGKNPLQPLPLFRENGRMGSGITATRNWKRGTGGAGPSGRTGVIRVR